MSRRALAGLGVLGVSAAVTGGIVLFRDRPEVRGALGDLDLVKDYAGGEKIGFIQNPHTIAALKQHGLALAAERAGSVEQVRDPTLLAGDVATADTLPTVLPKLVDLFRGMGFKSSSSGKVFDDYVAGGPGAQPMVVGYENQLVEWILADKERWNRIAGAAGPAKPVALYPKPTVYSAPP
ncbi:MAG TPA: hypothetical protein VNZ85_02530 [Caulobacter sp.]|nr:hypothetical protein [Caulobacter sp.]